MTIKFIPAVSVKAMFWDYGWLTNPQYKDSWEPAGREEPNFSELLKVLKKERDGTYEACLFMELENGNIENLDSIVLRLEGGLITIVEDKVTLS